MRAPAVDESGVRKGFSLVELLVVIAVVSLLLSLAAASFQHMKRRGAELKSLANLRTVSQTFGLYAERYGSYPWGTGGWGRPPWMGEPWAISFSIWDCERFWPVFFHGDAPWMENYAAWLSPGTDASRFTSVWEDGSSLGFSDSQLSSYSYSTSFVGDAGSWGGPAEPSPPAHPQRPDQVLFPCEKVLLFDADRSYIRRPHAADARPIAFADGSASLGLDSDAATPVQNSSRMDVGPRRYHDTPNGVRGRDF